MVSEIAEAIPGVSFVQNILSFFSASILSFFPPFTSRLQLEFIPKTLCNSSILSRRVLDYLHRFSVCDLMICNNADDFLNLNF